MCSYPTIQVKTDYIVTDPNVPGIHGVNTLSNQLIVTHPVSTGFCRRMLAVLGAFRTCFVSRIGWGEAGLELEIFLWASARHRTFYTAAIWWKPMSCQPNKMQSTYLSVSPGTKWGDAETDLLMLSKGQLITTFVSLSVYYQLGNVNGPSGSCDSPVPFSQIRGSEYEIIAKRRCTSSWSLWVTK